MKRGKLNTLIENLQLLTEQKQTSDILNIMKVHQQELIDLNIKQMDEEGVDAHGNRLRPYRNKAYANKKRALNPRGVTDLHLTGGFHRDMFLDASTFPVRIDSRNPKTEKLKDEYGDIFGFTAANKKGPAKEILKPSIEEYYRSFLVV